MTAKGKTYLPFLMGLVFGVAGSIVANHACHMLQSSGSGSSAYSGPSVEESPESDGSVRISARLFDMPQGPFRSFYASGRKRSECRYEFGIIDGPFKQYYDNEQSSIQYELDVLEGHCDSWKYYAEDGALLEEYAKKRLIHPVLSVAEAAQKGHPLADISRDYAGTLVCMAPPWGEVCYYYGLEGARCTKLTRAYPSGAIHEQLMYKGKASFANGRLIPHGIDRVFAEDGALLQKAVHYDSVLLQRASPVLTSASGSCAAVEHNKVHARTISGVFFRICISQQTRTRYIHETNHPLLNASDAASGLLKPWNQTASRSNSTSCAGRRFLCVWTR